MTSTMPLTRRLALPLLATLLAAPAFAQGAYPDKPVTVVVDPVKGPELNECPVSWTANGLKQVGTMKERFRLSVLLDGEQVAHLE